MEGFKWTNTDVIENLQQLKNEKVTVGYVIKFLKQQYNKTCALKTVYRHMPKEKTAYPYLNDEIVVTLQTKFANEMLAVKEGTEYRVYKKHRDIFECIDCFNAKTRPTPVPTLKEIDGHYMLNKGKHAEECRLHPINQLMARDIDRVVREETEKNPLMRPQQAYEKGQQHALKMAKNAGQTGKEPGSIAILFPLWHSIRNQYYRRRKMAATNVRDPFTPPKMYEDTYRAFVMENKERWLSLADEKSGIVMFASDDDYKAAAQCTLLMADGTFDLCPICFAQIFIIHGLFKGEWIAVTTCLMENRLEASYNVVFQHLQEKWAQLKIKPICGTFTAFVIELPIRNVNKCSGGRESRSAFMPELFMGAREPSAFLPIKSNGHCFYGSIALIVYGDQNEQARVRQELMSYLDKNRNEKWSNWICSREDVDDYIKDHAATPKDDFAERKHWGSTQQSILAARLYSRNFIVFQPDERIRFLHFSAAYENLRTALVPGPTSIIRYQHSHFDVVSQTNKE